MVSKNNKRRFCFDKPKSFIKISYGPNLRINQLPKEYAKVYLGRIKNRKRIFTFPTHLTNRLFSRRFNDFCVTSNRIDWPGRFRDHNRIQKLLAFRRGAINLFGMSCGICSPLSHYFIGPTDLFSG